MERGPARVAPCGRTMYLFGHIGITAAAARAADRDVDLRPVMALAILPDVIDKPLAFLFPRLVHGSTRGFAHTLLAAGLVLALAALLRRRLRRPLFWWACYSGHLLLDRMWLTDGPIILLWPLLGPFPNWSPFAPKTPHLLAYNIAGELVGMALIARLALRRELLRTSPSRSPR